MSNNGKPPAGGGRFLKLAGLTASVAGGYAQDRVKRMFLSDEAAAQDQQEAMARVGARIASTLGELKGAAMKMGQMASMAADLLPKEIADALQSLAARGSAGGVLGDRSTDPGRVRSAPGDVVRELRAASPLPRLPSVRSIGRASMAAR